MVGFRREYGLDWRDARRSMWHVDLGVLVDGLQAWSLTDENIARLVDREDYWLNSEYAQWTTDPNDPEVVADRERRRRAGIKPPPVPLLRPVARRPRRQQAELEEAFIKRVTSAGTHLSRKATLNELRAARGK